MSGSIKSNDVFLLDKSNYQRLINSDNVFININMTDTVIPLKLLQEIFLNEECYNYLTNCIKQKKDIEFALETTGEIVSKHTFSIVSIVMGLKHLINNHLVEINESVITKLNYLYRQVDFNKFLKKNKDNEFEILVDNKNLKLKYSEVLSIMLDPQKYLEFVNNSKKIFDLSQEVYVFCLKNLIESENILNCYIFEDSFINCYQYLIANYDMESINTFVTSDNLWPQLDLNQELVTEVYKNLPNNIKLEQIIYIYYILIQMLKYDEEFDELGSFATKHKDFSRIELVTAKNNKVVDYEFTAIYAKFLEKLNINYKYNESYIKFRYKKYLLKIKTISNEFNCDKLSIDGILNGITVLNKSKKTKNEFEQLLNKIYKNLYEQKINLSILKLPFTDSLMYYRKLCSKTSISFKDKLDLFYDLIGNTNNIGGLDIGYIYQLKEMLFTEAELTSNIRFITISENVKNVSNPVVIITVNLVNINLYNSNNYIYYNPPYPIGNYNLTELRKEFFNGRFSYVKGNKEYIVGLEKSSV